MPSRLPWMLVPSMKSSCQRQGAPSRIRRSPSASRRVTMRMSANARSAVASVSTPGVFATTSLRACAATSMLSSDGDVGHDP